MFDFPAATTLAIPLFVICVIAEWVAVKTGRAAGHYETADAITSLAMGLGNVAVNTLTGTIALWMFMLVWPYRLFDMPVTWWSFIAVFVLYDFVYYWKHRFAHRMRWFWSEHITHHSSEHYNLTTALRQPWFGPFTGLIILGWPMVMLGFHPAFIFFVGGLNLVYQFWIHTQAIDRMPGWFEAAMNTPSHHRVHHATNPRYLDRNYAGVFIVWDKMFGTFEAERDDEKIRYGIIKQLGSFNLLYAVFHEWIGMLSDIWRAPWRHKLSYLLREPGWTHDGSRDTSDTIRARWLARTGANPSPEPVAPRNPIESPGQAA